jgi:hypothetical protein
MQSEHTERVIMFSVQKPMDIMEGQFGVHIDSLAEPRNFSRQDELTIRSILLELLPQDNPFRSRHASSVSCRCTAI